MLLHSVLLLLFDIKQDLQIQVLEVFEIYHCFVSVFFG